MFDILRKKLQSFTEQFKQNITEKVEIEEEKQRATTPSPLTESSAKSREQPPIGKEKKTVATKHLTDQSERLKTNLGTGKKITSFFTGQIQIQEKDIQNLIEELELALLEADVEQETAQAITQHIQRQLVGQAISAKSDIDAFIRQRIREVLTELLSLPAPDLIEATKTHQPLVILLLGPNGAGKTTTLAKLTQYFQKHHKSCIWAASDTFRAASIEQLEHHSLHLGVRVVKHTYGADPAAVAFDAIQAARAHHLDVVLVDSAGRQETNRNLMSELEKLVRVTKPHYKLFIAESYSGQSLLKQASEFNAKLGIDGFILTKIDADPKGGTLLSLAFSLRKPIFFLGTGQGYEDLEKFDAEKITYKIL